MVAIANEKRTSRPKAPPCAENEGNYLDDGEPVDVTGWLTANQAVDLLGCSRVTLDRYARLGHIRPARARRDPNSMRMLFVYSPAELAKLPRKYRGQIPDEAGELAARCFELFDQGHTDRQVVIEMRQTPQKIDELRTQWADGGGALFVVTAEVRGEIAELLGEPVENVADLVRVLREHVAAVTTAANEER